MKYTVTLEYLVRTSVEVEADSPAGAAEAASHLDPTDVFGQTPDITLSPSSLEDGQPIHVLDEDDNDVTESAGL